MMFNEVNHHNQPRDYPMKQKNYATITDMIDRKEQLQSELERAEKSTWRLPDQKRGLELALREEKASIPGLQADADKGYQGSKKELNNRLDKVKAIEADLNRVNNEWAELNAQIADLKKQLTACDTQASLANVLEHQNAITATQGKLVNFQQLIAEQQHVITEAGNQEDTITPLIGQREELLADIALGEDKTADLEQLDNVIKAMQEERDGKQVLNKNTIAHAQQTISGLSRRLAVTQNKLNRLNDLTPKLLDLFVMTKTEQAANDFTALADQLIQKMNELIALDALVLEIGNRKDSGLFPDQASLLRIPCINGVKPLDHLNGSPGVYVNIFRGLFPFVETLNQIKQGMINQGVNI